MEATPGDSSIVGGTVMTFTANSSEPLVGWAFLYIDGGWMKSFYSDTPTTNLSLNYSWDTRQYSNGTSHSISIAGWTSEGNLWSESPKIWVTVDNSIPIVDTTAPTVIITSPTNDSTVGPSGETVPITVDAGDNIGIARVDYYIDSNKVSEVVYAPFTFTWSATLGNHTVSAVAYDSAGNYGFSNSVDITVPAKVYVTGPVDGSIVGGTVMTFTASSSEPLVGWAFLYIDGEWKKSFNLETPTNNPSFNYSWDTKQYSNGSSHSISIAGWTSDDNLWSESPKIWVTVDNSIPIVDTTAPTVIITSPTNDNTVGPSGETVPITVDAGDNVGIARVDYYIDSAKAGEVVYAPFTFNWLATLGNHTVSAVAYDAAGNYGFSNDVAVTIPAKVYVTGPADGSLVGGTVMTFTANSSEPLVGWAFLYIDGEWKKSFNLETPTNNLTLNYSWDTRLYADGTSHSISVAGRTADGNLWSESSKIWVTVDNSIPIVDTTDPTVIILSPMDGSIVGPSGEIVPISVDAGDNVEVARVDYYINSAKVNEVVYAPFTFNWPATLGNHTVSAVAYDAAGNYGFSNSVVVTVPARVTVTSPADGSIVGGKVMTFTADASDPLVEWAFLYIDGEWMKSFYLDIPTTTLSVNYSWDTRQFADGTNHSISIAGRTADGNIWSESSKIWVTVDNSIPIVDTTAPTVIITSPTDDSTVGPSGETMPISVDSGDNVGVARVDFYVDNAIVGEAVYEPFTFNWLSSVGNHTVNAVAYDAAGNYTVSDNVTVKVPAKVTITSPVENSRVSGLVATITANFSDPVTGWTYLYIDGDWITSYNVGESGNTATFNANWDTRLLTDGSSHYIEVAGTTINGNLWSGSKKTYVTIDQSIADTYVPVVSVSSPLDNAKVGPAGENVTITVSATDNIGVTRVDYYIDDVKVNETVYDPFTFNWIAIIGSHTVSAVAYDADNNFAISNSVLVTVPAPYDYGFTDGPLKLDPVAFYYGDLTNVGGFHNPEYSKKVLSKFPYIICDEPGEMSSEEQDVMTAIRDLTNIFGYVSFEGSATDVVKLKTQIDRMAINGYYGVFMDQFGYDWGNYRVTQNEIVDYAHSKGLKVFANSWIVDDSLGSTVNAVYNSSGIESHISTGDWYLGESFYVSTLGYYGTSAQVEKYLKMSDYQRTLGVNMVGLSYKRNDVTLEDSQDDIAASYVLSQSLGFEGWWFASADLGDEFLYGKDPQIDIGSTLVTPLHVTTIGKYIAQTDTKTIEFDMVDNLLKPVLPFGTTSSPPSQDTSGPEISITSPSNDSTVGPSGENVSITVNATDNVGVVKVEYYIDAVKVSEAVYAPFTFDWLSSVGNHTVSAVAYDAAGNYEVSNSVAIKVPAKVTITSPVENSTVSGVVTTITANFSDPVTGWTYLYIDGDWVTSYNVGESGTNAAFNANWDTTLLTDGSSHYIEVAGTTINGSLWSVSKKTYVTVNQSIPVVDITTPVVSVTSPSNDSIVGPSGENVSITVSATDNIGVTKVDYYIDNAKVNESVYAPFTFNWLSTVGNHTVSAVAYDSAGNYGVSNNVAVKVPAKVIITSPDENSSVSGLVATISADFSDPVTGWTYLYIDGDWVTSYNVGGSGTTAIFNANWDTTLLTDGSSHYIEVAGTTINGSLWSSSKKTYVTIDQSIDTSDPTVSITSPSNDSTVGPSGENVTITVNATDNVGVTKIEYYIDDVNVNEAVYAPFTFDWLPTVGNHTISAKAFDAAGNYTVSNSVTVKVPAKVTVTSPVGGSTVSGNVTGFTASSSDSLIGLVYLYIDGNVAQSIEFTEGTINITFSYSWDTSQYENGSSHYIEVGGTTVNGSLWSGSEKTYVNIG